MKDIFLISKHGQQEAEYYNASQLTGWLCNLDDRVIRIKNGNDYILVYFDPTLSQHYDKYELEQFGIALREACFALARYDNKEMFIAWLRHICADVAILVDNDCGLVLPGSVLLEILDANPGWDWEFSATIPG